METHELNSAVLGRQMVGQNAFDDVDVQTPQKVMVLLLLLRVGILSLEDGLLQVYDVLLIDTTASASSDNPFDLLHCEIQRYQPKHLHLPTCHNPYHTSLPLQSLNNQLHQKT